MNAPSSKQRFAVEQHGIDPVPKSERTKNWADLFVIYTGLNIAMATLLVGGLLVPALTWYEILFVVLVGNSICGVLLVLMGHIGVDHGVPAAVASRSFLGHPGGTMLSSVALVISLTGWFAVNAELGGMAVDQAVSPLIGFSSPSLMILLLGAGNVVVALVGIESIKWLSRLSVPLLLAVMVWLTAKILMEYSLIELVSYEATGEIAVTTAIDWTVGGLIVGVFIASDISRHVRSRRDNWIGVMLGVVPSAAFLMVLGALASRATGNWNPVEGVQSMGMGAPALFVIVFSTWTTNDINLYSGGLALTNIFPSLSRLQNTLILGVVGVGLAMSRITEQFTGFMDLLVYLFAPLVGVALADYFVVGKGLLRPPNAQVSDIGQADPWNINWPAWLAIVIGVVVGAFTPDSMLSSAAAIGSSALGRIVGGAVWRRYGL